jgi:hypothetical protein
MKIKRVVVMLVGIVGVFALLHMVKNEMWPELATAVVALGGLLLSQLNEEE